MQGILSTISEKGCAVKARGSNIIVLPPEGGEWTDELLALVDQVKDRKREALQWLREGRASPPDARQDEKPGAQPNAWTMIPPNEGEPYTVRFEGEAAVKRWGLAVSVGFIHLTDKVLFYRRTAQCEIHFRCAMPLEWLEREIAIEVTRTAQRDQQSA